MELDKIDTKILSELDMDARQTNTQIAKKLSLSKQVVGYRINKLLEKGVIDGFYTVINIAKFGYSFYRVWLKFLTTDIKKENEVINFLKNNYPISWIIKSEGIHDLVVLAWCKDAFEFEEIIDGLRFGFNNVIEIHDITVAAKIYHFKHKFLFGNNKVVVTGGKVNDYKLDNLDKRILSILAGNAREPIKSIAKKLGVSPTTVRYKIKKLMITGVVLAFRAKINSAVFGYHHFKVFLYFKNIDKQRYSDLIKYLKDHSNVVYITKPLGPCDLEFESKFKSIYDLQKMIQEMRDIFPDIIKNYDTRYEVNELLINYFPLK